jgi:hypothetical protein
MEESDKLNTVLLNLSYSFLAGLIFFAMVTYFPYRQRLKKIRPAITLKINSIHTRMSSCVEALQPSGKNNINITEPDLIKLLKNTPSITNTTTIQHLIGQRNEINKVVKDLIDYKEYLSDKQLVLLEKIREATYFSMLNIFTGALTNTPQIDNLIKEKQSTVPTNDPQIDNFIKKIFSDHLSDEVKNSTQIRESLAKEMYKLIENVKKLKSTI